MPAAPSLGLLRRARHALRGRFHDLPNVIGTGLGVKRRSGAIVTDAALVVVVNRKIAGEAIEADDCVPEFVEYGGRTIATDVIALGEVRFELGAPPYFLNDGDSKGVMTAFGRAGDVLYAVSCAHCMRGLDGNPHTTSPIWVWDGPGRPTVEIGKTVFAVDAPGYSLPGSFGFVDAGCAVLSQSDVRKRALQAPPLSINASPKRGTPVTGLGPHGLEKGTVDLLEVEVGDLKVDIVVRMSVGGTEKGHSGMLWRSASGQAVSMHGAGAHFQSGKSQYSLGTFPSRVAKALQITLLDPDGVQ